MMTLEERLWEYIDGTCREEERAVMENLLQSDPAAKKQYEFLLSVHQDLRRLELEEPSLRFTRNVMDRIEAEVKPRALTTHVDKRIIRFISAFFIGTLAICTGFVTWTMDWSSTFDTGLTLPVVNWSAFAGGPVVTGAAIVFLVATLAFVDRFFHWRRVMHDLK